MKSPERMNKRMNRLKQLIRVAFFSLSLITPCLNCTHPHNERNSIKQINHLLALKV